MIRRPSTGNDKCTGAFAVLRRFVHTDPRGATHQMLETMKPTTEIPTSSMHEASAATNTSSNEKKTQSKLPPGMVLGPDGKPCKICTAFRNWRPGTTSGTEADSNRDKQQGSRSAGSANGSSGSGSKQNAASGFSAAAGLAGIMAAAAGGGASLAKVQADDQEQKSEGEQDPMSYKGDEVPPECPPDVEVLGRSAWTFLHTTAAYFPDKPTPAQRASMISLLRSLPVVYPCGWCAQDFGKDLAANPPDVSSGQKLSEWLCQRHNTVNKKLGKSIFDCAKVQERWKDGPADGRCD